MIQSVQYLANELDAKLWSSSFATLDEAERFCRWFDRAEHVSEWDKIREMEAVELLRLRANLRQCKLAVERAADELREAVVKQHDLV